MTVDDSMMHRRAFRFRNLSRDPINSADSRKHIPRDPSDTWKDGYFIWHINSWNDQLFKDSEPAPDRAFSQRAHFPTVAAFHSRVCNWCLQLAAFCALKTISSFRSDLSVKSDPVCRRTLFGARGRGRGRTMSTTDEDPDKMVKNSWTPEVRSFMPTRVSPARDSFRRAWRTVKSLGGYFAFAAASGGGSPARRFAQRSIAIETPKSASRVSRSPPPSPNAGGRVASRANR